MTPQDWGQTVGGGHGKPKVGPFKFFNNYINIRERGINVQQRTVLDMQNTVWFYDDFFGDLISDMWDVSTGSAGTGAIVTGVNGTLELDTTVSDDDVTLSMGSYYNFDPTLNCVMELKMNSLTNATTNFGISYWGFYKDADEHAMFEVDTADDSIDCKASLQGGVGAVDSVSGVDIDTAAHIYKIECFDTGSVKFYIDNALVVTAPAGTLSTTGGILYTPKVELVDSGATQHVALIDYIFLYQDRT